MIVEEYTFKSAQHAEEFGEWCQYVCNPSIEDAILDGAQVVVSIHPDGDGALVQQDVYNTAREITGDYEALTTEFNCITRKG